MYISDCISYTTIKLLQRPILSIYYQFYVISNSLVSYDQTVPQETARTDI